MKKVINTLYAQEMDMGGIPVRQAIPTQKVEQIDPFLLLHHGSFPVHKGGNPLTMGVGPHPHRGFAPLSIVLSGEVHHRDSLGNSSIIGPGGFQWVHAARGIIHSERPSAALAQKGGAMEVIQLWINLPAARKMDAPAYIAGEARDLPATSIGSDARLYLIAGTYEGLSGPVKPASPMTIARIEIAAGGQAEIKLASGREAALYISRGKGKIGGYGLAESLHLYQLSSDGESISFDAEQDTEIVMLSGEPINEPLAHYGPFVMNNQTQIMQAMRDYQMGKMGILIEEY